jgi:hypothetical protein
MCELDNQIYFVIFNCLYFRTTTQSLQHKCNSEGGQMLPDGGIQLPKHVGVVIRNKKECKFQCIWLVIFYILHACLLSCNSKI